MNVKALVHRASWSKSIEVALVREEGKTRSVAEQLIMRTVGDNECIGGPTFTMQEEDAQALMDALWGCGLRPSEGSGSAGQLAATQKHLEDMRTLVFKGGQI